MSGNIIPWLLLIFGEIFTAAYVFRMYFLVFLGKPRSELAEKAKDPKLIYLTPLIVLAFLSLTLGIIQKPFYKFIDPSVYTYTPPLFIDIIPVIFSFMGIGIAYVIYYYTVNNKIDIHKNIVYRVVKNKFYLDTLYTDYIAERIILPLSYIIGSNDRKYDNAVDEGGMEFSKFGTLLRKIETGSIEYYVTFLIIGMTVLFIIIELLGVIK